MPAKLEEISAVYLGEKFRFENPDGDVVIGEARNGHAEPITIKGQADVDELQPHLSYRFYGRWAEYTNKRTKQVEKQFHFQTFVRQAPHGRAGVIRYLCQAPHIGIQRATVLWDKFGSDAVRILRESCDVAAAALGSQLNSVKAAEAAAWLEGEKAMEGCTIELIDLLGGRGFPKNTSREAVRAWGNRAAEFIRRCPYVLMGFRGCSFKKTDAMYTDLGLDPADIKRQALCGWYAIARNTEGHTHFPVEVAINGIREMIGGTKLQPVRALALAKRLGQMSPDSNGAISTIRTQGIHGPLDERGDRIWIAEGKKAAAELRAAQLLAEALHELQPTTITVYELHKLIETIVPTYERCTRCHRKLTADTVAVWNDRPYGPECIQRIGKADEAERHGLEDWLQHHPITQTTSQTIGTDTIEVAPVLLWPAVDSLQSLDDHQRTTLDACLINRIGILGGSPGTGKTFTAASLIKEIVSQHGRESVAVCAPTGKAARRLSETMASYGLALTAKTIHSLLGVDSQESRGGWGFKHGPHLPLPYTFLVVDESSMIDTTLMAALLSARARGTHVLFVGDVNQLPPVGHGAPLRDMIAAGLPYGELREIKRNDGGIVQACADIRDNKPWRPGNNLKVIAADRPAVQVRKMFAVIERLAEGGMDPIWDIQVIVPVNHKSPICRKELNKVLQLDLNHKPGVAGCPFKLSDKIVNTKNGFFPAAEDGDLGEDVSTNDRGEIYVANGELAEVLDVQEKLLIAKLSNPTRLVRIPRGKSQPAEDDDAGGDDEQDTGTGCSWDLGYALSCHKAQGSEWPAVLVMIDEYPGARQVCDRSWVYTAISRAKQVCVMLGSKATADRFCRQNKIHKRKTFLKELIERECERIQRWQKTASTP